MATKAAAVVLVLPTFAGTVRAFRVATHEVTSGFSHATLAVVSAITVIDNFPPVQRGVTRSALAEIRRHSTSMQRSIRP
jgi:hypothetical protein